MVAFVRRARAVARVATVTGTIADVRPRQPSAVARFFRSLNIWFWAIVGIPTLLAGVYYFAIASDLYLSEAKFIVRGPNKTQSSGAISQMLSGAGSAASDDTHAVKDFILSRDAVLKLDQQDDLRQLFSRPEADFVTRFPGLTVWRKDFEALYKTYDHFVSVEVDTASGVSTLSVKAYRPEDAQRITKALLTYSEQLVNQLNQRARQDSLSTFQHEVELAQQRIAETQTQLTAYRIKEKMLDPKTASTGPLALQGVMEKDLASARGQLAEMLKNAPNNPQIPLIRTRIASLENLISDERAKITGNNNSVAAATTEYERLELQRQLGEKSLASAFTSLEQARLEAQRQQLYLETIALPNLPDYPLYPKRAASFATVVLSCLLAYGIAWLLVASVREHASA